MVPFRFTRKIDKVTFKLGPQQLGESGRRVFPACVRHSKRLGCELINAQP